MPEIWREDRGARHGRPKIIYCRDAQCDVCEQEQICLGFDSSDDEYGPIWICEMCAHTGFTDGSVPVRGAPPEGQ